MLRILLVGNPRTVKGFNRLTKIPSLNLSSLAANADKNLCEIKVADLVVVDHDPWRYLEEIIRKFQPHAVGFTAMSFQYKTALDLAKAVKNHNKDIKVLMGGYHVTADSENIAAGDDMKVIDYLVSGEGEAAFNALVKALATGDGLEKVPGLSYRSNGKIVHNPRPPLLEIRDINIPDRDARWFKKGFHVFDMPSDVIETSRGCVFNCNFCSIRNMYGKTFRKFSTERILADLEDSRRHGSRAVFIADDNITLDGKRYLELCNEITKARLGMQFAIQASINGIKRTPGLPGAMARAGTKWVFLGIENVSDDALTFMHKNDQLKSSDIYQVVADLKKNGMIIVGGFIFGYPEDTRKTLVNNFTYSKKIGIDIQLFNILTPHLGTELREELLARGLVTNPGDYSKYNHWACNVKTNYLTNEELFRIRNWLEWRYPVESGAIFRLYKAYPWYFTKLMFRMIRNEPKNWIKFVTGILRRP
jgi:radical SAM superfamily enzyme YgiQ (UPF0313 family)